MFKKLEYFHVVKKYLAHFISVIFQPTLASSLSLLIFQLSFSKINLPFVHEYFYPFFFIIFCATYLLPSISIIFLKLTNTISSYSIDNKEDRLKVSVLICVIWISILSAIITKFEMSPSLQIVLIGQIVTIVLVSILNYFYKFSLHTFSISFLVFLLAFAISRSQKFDFMPVLYFSILIAGIVGWARLYLQKHTQVQLYVGYISGGILGILVSLLLF